jgi:hypothetical protein
MGDGQCSHGCGQTGAAQSVRALFDVWPAAGLGGEDAVRRSRRASICVQHRCWLDSKSYDEARCLLLFRDAMPLCLPLPQWP